MFIIIAAILFEFPIVFSWTVTIKTFVIAILFITLSGFYPTRILDKTTLVDGLEERDMGEFENYI